MTKNAYFGPNLAVFGPEILIIWLFEQTWFGCPLKSESCHLLMITWPFDDDEDGDDGDDDEDGDNENGDDGPCKGEADTSS